MIKVVNGATGIGSEIKLRDYSEPLQNQRELTSYSSRYVYPLDFGIEPDMTNISLFENQLIRIWRAMSTNPYIDFAIDDIVNEMISYKDEDKYPIDIDLTDTGFSKKIREQIHDEFIYIMKLLRFHKKSYTLLRDWYIDGKQYFYTEEGKDKTGKKTISRITVLDPLRTKRLVSDKDEKDVKFVYQDTQLNNVLFEIDGCQMIEVDSGLMDEKHQIWISYLNKAYIPLNQLQNIEDAMLIYRIARAPERRVFYIDVGQLPKSKAETYMKEVIRNCRNKMEYDPSTGKIKESVLHMSLLDDIYLPRSADGRGTEVTTMQGGNSSFMDSDSDLDYFKLKLFRSLNVPFTRWTELNGPANVLGRAAEITRDEVKYRKFINRLRNTYNTLFTMLLRKQCSLKKIISEKEYNDEYENIMFKWASDSVFAEMRDIEIFTERVNLLDRLANYAGQYYSTNWIKHHILKQTDEDIEEIKQDIEDEKAANPQQDNGGGGGFGGMGFEKEDSEFPEQNIIMDDDEKEFSKFPEQNIENSIHKYIKTGEDK